jgi:hypothetical protein
MRFVSLGIPSNVFLPQETAGVLKPTILPLMKHFSTKLLRVTNEKNPFWKS